MIWKASLDENSDQGTKWIYIKNFKGKCSGGLNISKNPSVISVDWLFRTWYKET